MYFSYKSCWELVKSKVLICNVPLGMVENPNTVLCQVKEVYLGIRGETLHPNLNPVNEKGHQDNGLDVSRRLLHN